MGAINRAAKNTVPDDKEGAAFEPKMKRKLNPKAVTDHKQNHTVLSGLNQKEEIHIAMKGPE